LRLSVIQPAHQRQVRETKEDKEEPPQPKGPEAIEYLGASLNWLESQEVDHISFLQLRSILNFPGIKRHAAFMKGTQ